MPIEKITKLPLREIWKNEAKDFTTWLSENIDSLAEILDLNLNVTGREKSVGPFSSDIVAEDDSGNVVIIENQLEKTDHDHLGKMVTYLSNLENAKIAIWISSNPREEHRKAVEWLNEFTPDDVCFYMVKVEAIMIGDSSAAPLFSVIAEPTEVAKQIGNEKKELAEVEHLRKAFWGQLLEKAESKTKMLANVSPSINHWIGTGAGKTGIAYNIVVTNHISSVEVYMDRGKNYPQLNKERFDQLLEHREEIERTFGQQLLWERLDKKRASRISLRFNKGIKDKESWDDIQNELIEDAQKIKSAFDPLIKNLKS